MSGVAVQFHRDGRTLQPATIQAMLAAIPHRALDGHRQRCWSTVGLGYAKLTVTPEEEAEQQPLISPRTGCAIVADVRLDNRDDLLARLPDHPPATTSDATLILLAYEAWETDAPARLLGDFAFAIWDPRKRRVVCARDTSGERTLFYRLDARTFAAASEMQQLAQDPEVTLAPNEARVRDYLVPWRVYRNDREQVATFYQGIFALLAGHVMVVDTSTSELRRYWELSIGRDIRYRRDQQYVQHFGDVFVAAVRARLRSIYPVGAALSGGLDSASVVSLAQLLYQRGVAENRGFVSYSMAFAGMECDETSFIRDVQAKYGFDARFYSPLGIVSNLDPEPKGFLPGPMKAPGELDSMLSLVAATGARTMLTGLLGDNCFGWSSRSFDSFLRRGRIGELQRQLRAYRDMSEESLRKSFALNGLLPLSPLAVQRAFWAWYRRREYRREQGRLVPEWISDDLRPDLLERHLGLVLSSERSRRFGTVEREQTFATLYPPETSAISGAYPVQLLRPFADRRLHEFLLAIPPEQLFEPHPYVPGFYPGGKLILRRAMRGILPESIRTRTDKPHFTAFVLDEIERRWAEYAAVFGPHGRSEVAARGYVDPARFWRRIERMRAGEFDADGIYVVRVLNLETWLRTFNLPRDRQTTTWAWAGATSFGSSGRGFPLQPMLAPNDSGAGLAPASDGAPMVEISSGRG